MELLDVYTAFAQTKPSEEEEDSKKNEKSVSKLKYYKFGSIIEYEGSYCYKI